MLNLNYLPVHFSLFLTLGIIIGNINDVSIISLLVAGVVTFLFLIYFYFRAERSYKRPIYFVIFTSFLFVNIGILSITIQKPQNQKKHYINHLTAKNRVILRIDKILKPNKFYNRYEAQIIQANNKETIGTVLVNIIRDSLRKKIDVDDLLYTSNHFKEVQKALNPYQFDFQKYLKRHRIYHQMALKKNDFFLLDASQKTLKGYGQTARERIMGELEKFNFLNNELAIVHALLLGQRQDISKEQFQQYRDAGAIHILAVSGLHIGIILLFLNFLFNPLERLKKGVTVKLIIIIFCLWSYAVLAGLSASVVRAVAMFSAVAVGLTSNRPTEVRNSLVISYFFLLLINPFYLYDVGFQLSYTAVFSIVWLQPFFSSFLKPKSKLFRYFWSLLTVTFAAQIGILPLSLFYFHQIPGLFFISSLAIIPFLGIILGLGFLVVVLALMQILPQYLANIYEIVLRTLNNFVAFISHQEAFIIQNISFSNLLLVASYAFLICCISWMKNRSIKNLSFVLIAILFIQGSLIIEKFQTESTNEFVLFHQNNNSVFGIRKGNTIEVYQKVNRLKSSTYSPLSSYRNKLNLIIKRNLTNRNILKIDSKYFLIIDSTSVYNSLSLNPEIVILINSPKINLNRMIQILKPKTVIVDGSNYRSYVALWEKSCNDKEVKFYNTSVNGAFVYNYKP